MSVDIPAGRFTIGGDHTALSFFSGAHLMRAFAFAMCCCLSLCLIAGSQIHAEPPGFTELQIGDQAPDFTLPGVDGKDHSLDDFADAKLLLVIFTCNHCPTAQAYEPRIIQLQADYKDKGVALVAISPNDNDALRLDEFGYSDVGDSFDDMKIRAEEKGFTFPYLYDGETQKTSLAYGVAATPQAFLFDGQRKLRYVGRIDDSDVKEVTSHDVRNAIEALLAGRAVPVEKTRTYGCSTKWSEKRESARKALEKWNQEPVTLNDLDEETLKELVRNDTEKLLLINVWASWCVPCVAELPELVNINRMYRHRKFRMVTISIDEPEDREQALKMLQERHVSTENYLATFENRDGFAELLDPEWAGPVPYTLMIAPGGKVLHRWDTPVEPLEVRRAIVDVLGRTYGK